MKRYFMYLLFCAFILCSCEFPSLFPSSENSVETEVLNEPEPESIPAKGDDQAPDFEQTLEPEEPLDPETDQDPSPSPDPIATPEPIPVSPANPNIETPSDPEPEPITQSVSILSYPTKMKYYLGEEIDTAGLTLAILKSDGTCIPAQVESFTVSAVTDEAGMCLVILTGNEGTVSFPVLVSQFDDLYLINGGKFTMGSNIDNYNDNPERDVSISSFLIGKYEVTYAVWKAVYDWSVTESFYIYTYVNAGKEGHDGIIGAPCTSESNEPVTYISWVDSVLWCNARSELEGLSPVYFADSDCSVVLRIPCADGVVYRNLDASGYRLPTEAEWEYAAGMAGGEEYTTRYIYAGTDDVSILQDYAWNLKSCGLAGRKGTWTVGSLKPNERGCFDFSGNVAEWCEDWYDENWYSQAPSLSSTGPEVSPDNSKLIRGSSWQGSNPKCAVTSREAKKYNGKGHTLGFRVGRSF